MSRHKWSPAVLALVNPWEMEPETEKAAQLRNEDRAGSGPDFFAEPPDAGSAGGARLRSVPLDDDEAGEHAAKLEDKIAREVERLRVVGQAARIYRDQTAPSWKPPEGAKTLAELLANPPSTPLYLINKLQGWNHNVVLAAQYKTGKTTIALSYAHALVDERPFLGEDTRLPAGTKVAWWNGEMDEADFGEYARPLGIERPDLIATLHCRGERVPIMRDDVADWVVGWLRNEGAAVWIVDSWRRLCAWSGVGENKNEEVEQLTARIDEIKQRAGVQAFLTLAHTGRAEHAEGSEHARGATALDDWADARWIMTRDGDARFFRAEGRSVEMPSTALAFDAETRRMRLGSGTKADIRHWSESQKIVDFLSERGKVSTTNITIDALGRTDHDTGPVTKRLEQMEREGRMSSEKNGSRGRRWWLVQPGDPDQPGINPDADQPGNPATP